MRAILPLLAATDFPPIRRSSLHTLQVNLGYRCNQRYLHCHVWASSKRTKTMAGNTNALMLGVLHTGQDSTLDPTGGAPELEQHFRHLARPARARGGRAVDRSNFNRYDVQRARFDPSKIFAWHGVDSRLVRRVFGSRSGFAARYTDRLAHTLADRECIGSSVFDIVYTVYDGTLNDAIGGKFCRSSPRYCKKRWTSRPSSAVAARGSFGAGVAWAGCWSDCINRSFLAHLDARQDLSRPEQSFNPVAEVTAPHFGET